MSLFKLNNKNTEKVSPPIGQIVTITSGKGGVGKTSVAINLGLALVQRGLRVCVVDADTNLANINIMLKQVPEYTLEHVINGEKDIHEIMMRKDDLFVVPAATGISSLVNQSRKQSKCVIDAVTSLRNEFDYVLIDTAAGISDSVLRYIQASHQSIFVITSEPTSLTDSYSLMKVLFKNKIHKNNDIVVNFAQNEKHAMNVFTRFSNAVEKYMDYKVGYLGFVFRDDYLSSSVCFQNPLLIQRPNSRTSQCFRDVAQNLCDGLSEKRETSKPAEMPDTNAEFSSDEVVEKTVSLANLENDIDEYLKSNSDSKNEIGMTLKKLAEKYQQVFEEAPVKSTVENKHIKQESTEAKKPVERVPAKNVLSSRRPGIGEENVEYQGYLDSIHFASLLSDYAEGNKDRLH